MSPLSKTLSSSHHLCLDEIELQIFISDGGISIIVASRLLLNLPSHLGPQEVKEVR